MFYVYKKNDILIFTLTSSRFNCPINYTETKNEVKRLLIMNNP